MAPDETFAAAAADPAEPLPQFALLVRTPSSASGRAREYWDCVLHSHTIRRPPARPASTRACARKRARTLALVRALVNVHACR